MKLAAWYSTHMSTHRGPQRRLQRHQELRLRGHLQAHHVGELVLKLLDERGGHQGQADS